MKRKIKAYTIVLVAAGLVIGWNIQNEQVVEALIGSNTLVSRDSSGTKGNSDSMGDDMSSDGRYVVFSSFATNLVAGDTNGYYDVFLKDTVTNSVTRVSVDSSGGQANGHSQDPKISGDGKYVMYKSSATNLVAGDTNGYGDVFRHNIATAVTERASVDSSGTQANGYSDDAVIDLEGRFVAFTTTSTNLDPAVTDTNGVSDVAIKDMQGGTVTYLSQSDAGVLSNGSSNFARISCDGRYVVFTSSGSNLVASDTNGQQDVFLSDLLGTRTLTSTTLGGNGSSSGDDISCDGRYVLYTSSATNQISGDTNGVSEAFRYERTTGTKQRVSLKEDGTVTNQQSGGMALSSDGKYALFATAGTLALTTTAANYTDYNTTSLLIREMASSSVRTVNVKSNLETSYSGVYGRASFSGSNRVIYSSKAHSLVADDNNGIVDVFVVDLGPANTCIL